MQYEIIALDTEFMWRNTYYPKLCLIQIATPDQVYLIDPLADIDLKKLKPILEDLNILKVFHAAQHDISILDIEADANTQMTADTQTAAEFLGLIHQGSLQWLLSHYNLADLPKKQKLSNWAKRPLTDGQISYAKDDVLYLIDAYLCLKKELENMGRLSWFQEESQVEKPPLLNTTPQNAYKKISGQFKFPYPVRQRLKKLTAWRETQAIQKNTLVRYILENESLIKLCFTPPTTSLEIKQPDYQLSSRQAELYSETILKILFECDLPDDTSRPPRKPKINVDKTELNALQAQLQDLCEQANIIPPLVASKTDLKLYIQKDPKQVKRLTQGWRKHITHSILPSHTDEN